MGNPPEPSQPQEPHREARQRPKWIPSWMTERERCALILAAGIVVGFIAASIILSFGIYFALHEGPIDIR